MKNALLRLLLIIKLYLLETLLTPAFDSALSRAIDRAIVRLEETEVRR